MSARRDPDSATVALVDQIYAEVITALVAGKRVLVTATAGAGKTRLLVAAIDALATPVLAVTFNRSAAKEIQGRCVLLQAGCRSLTIQKLCADAFRHFNRSRTHWVTGPEREDLIGTAVAGFPHLEASSRALQRKLRGLLDGSVRSVPRAGSYVSRAIDTMAEIRRRRGWYDAWDIEVWVSRHPDLVASYVVKVLKITALAVDEAQDLTVAEWAFVNAWADLDLALLVVGDLDQSINVFRGAHSPGIVAFGARSDVLEVSLPVTWRSSEEVAATSLRSLRQAMFPGSASLLTAHDGGHGSRLFVHHGSPARVERTVTNAVVAEVLAATGHNVPTTTRQHLPREYDLEDLTRMAELDLHDVCILTATNRDADALASVLKGTQLPVVRLSGRHPDPLATVAARVLIAALDVHGETARHNGSNRTRWLRCLLGELSARQSTAVSPRDPMGRSLTHLLAALAENDSEGPLAGIDRATRWLTKWDGKTASTTGILYLRQARRVLDLIAGGQASPAGAQRIVAEVAAAYSLTVRDSMVPFAVVSYAAKLATEKDPVEVARSLRQWPTSSKGGELPPLEDGERRVVVAVINQAKGLTFEAAWVCALRGGTFPHRGKDSHEERCRFWVGCTRAMDLLSVHVHEEDRTYVEMGGAVKELGLSARSPRLVVAGGARNMAG